MSNLRNKERESSKGSRESFIERQENCIMSEQTFIKISLDVSIRYRIKLTMSNGYLMKFMFFVWVDLSNS